MVDGIQGERRKQERKRKERKKDRKREEKRKTETNGERKKAIKRWKANETNKISFAI